MSQNASKPAAEWLNYAVKTPIWCVSLDSSALKLLYRLLASKQAETRDFYLSKLVIQKDETESDFEDRCKKVGEAFVISVTIHGFNEKLVTGNSFEIFDSPNLPEKIRSILYSTHSVPAAVLRFAPADRAMVFLDFTKPPVLDLSRLPTWPTPNDSNYSVEGDNSGWCTSTSAAISEFLVNRKVNHNWLHAGGTYDFLFHMLGIPLGILSSYEISRPLASKLPPIIMNAICVYTFFTLLLLLRFAFTYARWVYPKIELKGHTAAIKHRILLYTLTIGVIGGLAANFIWAFL